MPYTQKHFTPEVAAELVQQYGSLREASLAVYKNCTSERYNRPVSPDRVKRWISVALGGSSGQGSNQFTNKRLLDAERITKAVVGQYEVVTVDRTTGHPVTTTAHTTRLTIVPDPPKFPVVQSAAPTTIVYNAAPYIGHRVSAHAVISDTQIGFLRDQDSGKLEPIHDPAAMDVAKQIVADVRPVGLYFIGDWMDWPTFSRWQKYPEYYGTVQPSIECGHQELASFIAAAGSQCQKRVMIGSNHKNRPEKFLLEYNMDALGIRRAGSPHDWPVFSEPYLLRYEELGVEFSGQYPAGEYYLLPDLVLIHAPPKKLEYAASVIHGHTHHLTRTTAVAHSHLGRQTYFVYDIGCLCQLGTTTNTRRLMVTGTPSDRGRTDWAHGMAVVETIEGKIPRHEVTQVGIRNGYAIYQRQEYKAR